MRGVQEQQETVRSVYNRVRVPLYKCGDFPGESWPNAAARIAGRGFPVVVWFGAVQKVVLFQSSAWVGDSPRSFFAARWCLTFNIS